VITLLARRAHHLLAAFCVAVWLGLTSGAWAQEWPSQPVQLVVPFVQGSTIDRIARMLESELVRIGGKPVSVENRPGPAGTIAVMKAPADGHVILLQWAPFIWAGDTMPAPFRYDIENDFSAVTTLAAVPLVLVVDPNRYKSLDQLVAEAKTSGRKLTFATQGNISASAIAAFRLVASAGIGGAAQPLPIQSVQASLETVADHHVDFYFAPLAAARPFLSSGKLRALATSGSRRSTLAPDLPTTLEAGYKDSDFDYWMGLFVPKATPPRTIETIYQLILRAMEPIRNRFAEYGTEPYPLTPVGLNDLIRSKRPDFQRGQVGDSLPGHPRSDTPPPKK